MTQLWPAVTGHFATLRFGCTIKRKSLNYKTTEITCKVSASSSTDSYTRFRVQRRNRLGKAHASVNSSEIPSPLWLPVISLSSLLLRNIRAASGNARTCWRRGKNHPRHSPCAQLWGEDEDWRGHQGVETNSRWWTGETPETIQEAEAV